MVRRLRIVSVGLFFCNVVISGSLSADTFQEWKEKQQERKSPPPVASKTQEQVKSKESSNLSKTETSSTEPEVSSESVLLQFQEQMKEKLEQLKKRAAESGKKVKDKSAEWMNTLDDSNSQESQDMQGLMNRMKRMQSLLSTPWFRKFLDVATDDKLHSHLSQVLKRISWVALFFGQIGLVFFFVIFRAWRSSKVEKWWQKLWVSTYCSLLYAGMALIGLPFAMTGQPYLDFLWRLWEIS